MIQNNGYAKYRNSSINTATPGELTLMLYNGAIKFCNQAIVSMETKDLESAHKYIIRVQDIIEEFIITLDRKYPISESLELMYDYIDRRLKEANADKNVEILNEVLGYLRELRDTWKEAMKLSKTQKNNTAQAMG